MKKTLKPIIGLEVHIELETKSKMFCSCSARHFGEKANVNTCPVCLGLPGALPFANQEAIEKTLKLGLAFGSKINLDSKFDRKHYFYPDLPKAYQISQYDQPLCLGGSWPLANGKKIELTRIHLEEDTGKLIHQKLDGRNVSLVDFNRSGVPLLELVTEPDFSSVEEVLAFLKDLRLIVRHLGVSNADMEKGSMRLEANVSLSLDGKRPSYKVELKNINSFKFLEKALKAETKRQKSLLLKGEAVSQETRGYDEETGTTYSQRVKEEAQDYRYFPEPDLPPLKLSPRLIEKIKNSLGELPRERQSRLVKEYAISPAYAEILVQEPLRADYFERAVKDAQDHGLASQKIAQAMINAKLDEKYELPSELIIALLKIGKRDKTSAGQVKEAVEKVLGENEKAIGDYQKGKKEVIGFLIGQVQTFLAGKGNPQEIKKALEKRLK